MAAADVRWLQRLDNYERALGTLARALSRQASGRRVNWKNKD